MEITVAEQGLFLLPAKVTPEQAKEKAWEQKLNAFGALSKFVALSTGGRFFDARTAGDLSAALQEAVKLEYVAFDATGKVVGKARIGDPLRLPEGTYTIVVRAGQQAGMEGVKVTAKASTLLLRRAASRWALKAGEK